MKKIFLFLIILAIYGCNKPKTVLICGDHVCINKAEAEQYFEENLTLEVQIIDNKKDKKDVGVWITYVKDSDTGDCNGNLPLSTSVDFGQLLFLKSC